MGLPRLKPECNSRVLSPLLSLDQQQRLWAPHTAQSTLTSAPSCHPALTQTHTHTRELCSPQHTYTALRASLASRTPGYNPKPCRSPPHLSSCTPLLLFQQPRSFPSSSVLAESISAPPHCPLETPHFTLLPLEARYEEPPLRKCYSETGLSLVPTPQLLRITHLGTQSLGLWFTAVCLKGTDVNSMEPRSRSRHREQGVLPHQALGEASPGVLNCPLALLLGQDCPWQLSAGTPVSPARGRVLLQRREPAPAARLQGQEMLVGLWPDHQAQAAQPPALRLGVAVAGRFSHPCLLVRLCPPGRPMPAPRAERTDREGLEEEECPQQQRDQKTALLGRGDSRSHEQTQTGGRGSRNHGGRRAWGARAQACRKRLKAL